MPQTQYIIAEGEIYGTWHLYEVKPLGTIKSKGGYVVVDDEKENPPVMNLIDAAKEILRQKSIRAIPQPRIRVSTFKWLSRNDP